MVCTCWMCANTANTDTGVICNPCDRYSRENVQAGSKKSFFLVRKFLQAYDLQGHKLRLHHRKEDMWRGQREIIYLNSFKVKGTRPLMPNSVFINISF